MVDILVRNVDEATAQRLKEKAKARGASLNDTAREAFAAYIKPDRTEMWAKADEIRRKIGKVSGDSTKIIRAWRDNKEPHR
jgi:plasmid stability protein